ncbi:uncharacterized protein DC041_0001886, partial [Schistosoma bovis]
LKYFYRDLVTLTADILLCILATWATVDYSTLFTFCLLLPHIYFKDVNNNQRTVVQSFSLRNRAVFPIGFLSKFLVANSLSVFDVNNNQRTVVQSFSLRNRAVFPIGFLSKILVVNSMSVS